MTTEGETVVVLNPAGGSDNQDQVRERARERGYRVVETEGPGDGVRLAREAAASASTVVAAGGDGTVHEVVNGLADADALARVTFGVVPSGTGNNFAGNVGVDSVDRAFEVLAEGAVRTVDLGTFEGAAGGDGAPAGEDASPGEGATGDDGAAGDDGTPAHEGSPADDDGTPAHEGSPAEKGVFVNSCIGGVTAEASGQTTSDMKQRYGVFAYVVETVRTVAAFDPLPLTVAAGDGTTAWSGDAAFVLVGNGRRFPAGGRTQGDMEDGLLEVTIVEEMPAGELLGEAAIQRLFGRDTEHVTRLRSPSVDIAVSDGGPASFSLDGEMGDYATLSLGVRERALSLHVGEGYRPDPDREE